MPGFEVVESARTERMRDRDRHNATFKSAVLHLGGVKSTPRGSAGAPTYSSPVAVPV